MPLSDKQFIATANCIRCSAVIVSFSPFYTLYTSTNKVKCYKQPAEHREKEREKKLLAALFRSQHQSVVQTFKDQKAKSPFDPAGQKGHTASHTHTHSHMYVHTFHRCCTLRSRRESAEKWLTTRFLSLPACLAAPWTTPTLQHSAPGRAVLIKIAHHIGKSIMNITGE